MNFIYIMITIYLFGKSKALTSGVARILKSPIRGPKMSFNRSYYSKMKEL